MMGTSDQPGIIPHVSNALFSMLDQLFEDGQSVTVEGSYLEIYQERVFDLLDDYSAASSPQSSASSTSSSKGNKSKSNKTLQSSPSMMSVTSPQGLKLREDTKTGIFVEGLSAHPVAGYTDVVSLIENGLHRRTVAATI
jgi:hypothetical protein